MNRQHPRIIVNDDGWILTADEALATPETIHERMVSSYEGSPVDVVSWCVGNQEVYDYETQIGERFGTGSAPVTTESERARQRNIEHLMEVANGPLREITRQFHRAGMGLYASVRMNSHYAISYRSAGFGDFRRRHPEWLLGQPDEHIPAPTIEYATRTGLDYKHQGVRDHMEAIACELFEKFEVDGVELDFMRHPTFFRLREGRSHRYLMTDMLRRIRARMEAVPRPVRLLVRVPPTLADSERLGLDVRRWMAEGLVDDVVAGGGFTPFETPVEEFVKAAKGTGCFIYGSLEALRPALDEEVVHAAAARSWSAGAQGLYLFNYYGVPAAWKRTVLADLADVARLAGLSKRYELDHTDRVSGKEAHGGAFNHAHPQASLPVTLEPTLEAGGAELELVIAEAAPTPTRCTLELGFGELSEADELEVCFNERCLERLSFSREGWEFTCFNGPIHEERLGRGRSEGVSVRYEVGPKSLERVNRIRIRLIRPDPNCAAAPVLTEVRLHIGDSRHRSLPRQ
ncbi:MAG: hypothetical protein VX733_13690 [Candidatus Latescibacterota bacterium]|nr:hypothetical protein [Candidatus Latescibacterota bacterium]